MKRLVVLGLILNAALPVNAQKSHGARGRANGAYLIIGGAIGPTFSDFFSYINSTYQMRFQNNGESIRNFGSNVSLSLGYISRFHRNFALDVGFSIYGLHSKGRISNRDGNPDSLGFFVRHELDYQVGIFTATLPIIFEFSPRQPVVPYVGIGVSVFAMRLDDFRDDGIFSEAFRDTRTSVGGHFEAGVAFKISQRIWLDARARWHDGTGHLSTLEENFRDFGVKQSVSQYGVGVDYFFR
jgi:opacity protein-like surface antigen